MIIANEDKLAEAIARLFQGKIPLRLVTNAGGGNIGTFKRDWLGRTTKYEKDYLRVVLPIFKSIAEEVKKNVKKHPNNPKFWTFDVNNRKRQLIVSEAKMIARVYPKEGQIGLDLVLEKPEEFAKDAFVGITFDVEDERAIKQALERSNKLGSVAGNLHDDLHRKIANGIKEGLPMEDIAKSIVDYVELRSVSTSLMVARTETIWASNAGAEMGYIQSGVVQGKQWLGGQAGICDICLDMDGMTAPLGGDFDVSKIMDKYGINFDYQEGHMPFPPLHPNCRCTIVPITKGSNRWKPTMTQAEADRWAKNSVLKEPVYHGTSASNASKIKNDGFALRQDTVGGKVLGDGTYVTPNKKVSDLFELLSEEKAETLMIKIDIRNPYMIRNHADEMKLAKMMSEQNIRTMLNTPKYLQSLGYDAIDASQYKAEWGINIFNPRNVTVIK